MNTIGRNLSKAAAAAMLMAQLGPFVSASSAALFTYAPAMTTEVFEDDIFDDDLDVFGGPHAGPPIFATAGDTIQWLYDYEEHYEVLSSDRADIDFLEFFGMATPGTTANIRTRFSLKDGGFTPWVNFPNVPLALGGFPTIIEEDDVLGVLDTLLISDFAIEMSLTAGTFNLNSISYGWEVGDIEIHHQMPEPAVLSLLVTSALFGRRRRRAATESFRWESIGSRIRKPAQSRVGSGG